MCDEFFVKIEDEEPVDHHFGIRDKNASFELWIVAECHHLGADTGKDLALDVASRFRGWRGTV